MGRPVVLSNGQMFVGLDENGLVHDFYYPYVGLENLTNARNSQHKIGVWIDGKFSWTNDGSWQVAVNFEENALISVVTLRSKDLKVTLRLQDFVDPEVNALVRHITVTNEADNKREIRLFMHQVFQISRAGRADTAMYVPDDHYILDYKGRYCLAIGGRFVNSKHSFDQYSVGNFRIEGKEGTFKDAEDGELSMNAVEHGGVDSVIRFTKSVEAKQNFSLNYWIIVASSQYEAGDLYNKFKEQKLEDRLRHTRQHWEEWLGESKQIKLDERRRHTLNHSLMIIKAHCDERGSVLASGDSSIFNFGRDYYCYCWPRDAAYALWPLIRFGHFDEAESFFEFARDTMHKDGYLMHKYQPDRSIGSTWHPLIHGRRKELAIQEDETASVIYMIGEYYEATQDIKFVHSFYSSFIVPCANFMASFIDKQTGLPHASYDLWEEKFLTSTYTTSTVIGALQVAARLANVLDCPDDNTRWKRAAEGILSNLNKLYHPEGYFIKGFLLEEDGNVRADNTVDISNLYGPYMYAGLPLDDDRLTSTAGHVEASLVNTNKVGGVLRYENDNYFRQKLQYKGNPWPVCTLWLAQYYIAIGEYEKSKPLLEWTLDRQLPSGALSEQYDPVTAEPLSVTPLVWSHAELINTLLDSYDAKSKS